MGLGRRLRRAKVIQSDPFFECHTVTQTGDVCQNYQSEGQGEASVERPKKSSEPFRVGGRLARSWTNMALLLIVPGRALECDNQPSLTPYLTFLQSHSTQLVYDEKSSDMSSYCTIFDVKALRHFNNSFGQSVSCIEHEFKGLAIV